jgi:hypothetical protein
MLFFGIPELGIDFTIRKIMQLVEKSNSSRY